MPLQQVLALVGNIVHEMLNLQLKKVYDRNINGGMDVGSHEASPQ